MDIAELFMEAAKPISAIERARKLTLLLIFIFDVVLIAFTLMKGHPTIWTEFEREKNAWTFGNSMQAVLVAVVAYINCLIAFRKSGHSSRLPAWMWVFLACAFVFFAADDMLMFHERGGHAVEHAAPFLSRSHIVVYMDDLFELGYAVVGAIFGLTIFNKVAQGRSSTGYFVGGAASLFTATMIGLNPAVKSIPFPLAVIQILQLTALYLFFVSFVNYTSCEIASIVATSRTMEPGADEVTPAQSKSA
ncbi:MAG: hypothetical protein Q7N50_09220 [Armatimonadota bacterium]|nr:hypothetical protein [Armatimonadota bacterium]